MSKKKDKEKKPLEFYLSLSYPITFYPEEVGGFTVEIPDLPGCLSQGETLEEAFEMIAEARELWLEVAYDYGDPIPMPSTELKYSGKTMLRMPKYLHERLAAAAKREETSLNQYIVSLLSERNALRTVERLQMQVDELQQKEDLAKLQQQSQREEAIAYSSAEGSSTYAESSTSA
ncbi:type II toxin-antitoxin system HicB family antitoxin [cf. Phormidesmis sp. LEGE 11477]|uniref:type II toxin-antitoxin system HicB family antitoxin n=1 Tax=cf. Phormidesmis sp. LEGE 11477 TaxID=1828680 RepID=UPI00188105A3|nr:type II toxin-antitoxin system HicB family antitoxin [cf. Phormidesmis sp. LEGE 11477]MBE9060057.1 type II toxin-antitoxin system HicB family antitoxin [cf. Phormidesmis sp. LEGE 11477]